MAWRQGVPAGKGGRSAGSAVLLRTLRHRLPSSLLCPAAAACMLQVHLPAATPAAPGARGGAPLRLPPGGHPAAAGAAHAGGGPLPVSGEACRARRGTWRDASHLPVPAWTGDDRRPPTQGHGHTGGCHRHKEMPTAVLRQSPPPPPTPPCSSEDQGLFPGADLPVYTRELKYGSPQEPIRWGGIPGVRPQKGGPPARAGAGGVAEGPAACLVKPPGPAAALCGRNMGGG